MGSPWNVVPFAVLAIGWNVLIGREPPLASLALVPPACVAGLVALFKHPMLCALAGGANNAFRLVTHRLSARPQSQPFVRVRQVP